MYKVKLDIETADQITLTVLKEQLDILKKEVKDHVKRGTYMHPEDLQKVQTEYIPALKVIIKYFGG